MQDLVISLNKNKLRVITISKEGLGCSSRLVEKNIVDDNLILDENSFASILKELIKGVTNTTEKKLSATFLISPEEFMLRYITLPKGDGDIETRVMAEIQDKMDGDTLENYFFSYQKLAPFVYQFVAIKKEILEKYLSVANILGISLRALVPWIMLLPKYAGVNSPSIFITNYDGEQVVALSELGGVFFAGVYEKEKQPNELQTLVQKLSVYKRPNPISKVYTMNYDSLFMNQDYAITNLDVPNEDLLDEKGYEMNLLVQYMLDTQEELFNGQLNLLNLLPVPVKAPANSRALVSAGIPVVIILMVVGVLFVRMNKMKSGESGNTASNKDYQEVLSENTSQSEPSQTQNPAPEEIAKPDLKREDLKIGVQNGAGIPGVAGKTKEYLEKLGYKVDEVGNADETGRVDTLLKFKKDKAVYADLLKEDMKEGYSEINVAEDLEDTSSFDLVVVVGTTIK